MTKEQKIDNLRSLISDTLEFSIIANQVENTEKNLQGDNFVTYRIKRIQGLFEEIIKEIAPAATKTVDTSAKSDYT